MLISPDGALARFPWAALPGEAPGTYILEEQAIAVVPVPRLLPELLQPLAGDTPPPSLLLVGDVDFEALPGAPLQVAMAPEAPQTPALHRTAPRTTDSGTLRWEPLLNTRTEVLAIRDSFERGQRQAGAVVTLRRAEEPTEEEIRQQAPRHRYLHFATHGFFAPPHLRSALATAPPDSAHAPALRSRQDMAAWHPGLLSGLVLAGANQPVVPERDDGVLTALEMAQLDLHGVELATLSACDTGLGETAGGEGVLGLQRALQVAGARSVVATLWPVHDKAAQALMVEFYDNLWRKKMPKLAALRAAQLTMLREGITRGLVPLDAPASHTPRRVPPAYWAAFVLSGDWR